MAQMTGDDIERERLARAMSYGEFGKWLAQRHNEGKPESEHVKPYGRTRVYEWANDRVAVPAKVELIFKDLQIERLEKELAKTQGKEIEDPERER